LARAPGAREGGFQRAFEQAVARHSSGDLGGAIRAYRELLDAAPSHAGLLVNLGTALKQAGKREEALDTLGRAVELDAAPAAAWFNYGNLLFELRRREAAEAAYRRALERDPELYPAAARLARLLYRRGELEESERWYRAALERAPRHAETLNSLGVVLKDLGRRDEAIDCWRRATAINPRLATAHNNLGALYRLMRRPRLAHEHLRTALQLAPRDTVAAANLAHVLLEQGRTSEAETLARRIVERDPASAEGHHMLGFALAYQCEIEPAIEAFLQAHRHEPKSGGVISNALFASLYSDRRDAQGVLALHRELAPRIRPARPAPERRRNERGPERRLRIGYLSPDLRTHPVSAFLEPVLAHHERARFEVACYSTTSAPDAVTERLRAHAAIWRDCSGWSDARVAELIEVDGVDILVDLAGHTALNSAAVLRSKPAPVQALYIGYPSTSGLPEMDYVIADGHLCPPGSETLYGEKVVRVEGSYWCFRPPADAPAVGALPALASGHVTFGSYNAYQKLGDTAVALWARVLRAVPDSRLVLKALAFADPSVRRRAQRRFADAGIAESRIEAIPPTEPADHYADYGRLDVALDTTPYNGATTTCEALWMGVPVISLAGDRFCGRMGLSLLENLGLPELVARDADSFLQIAVALASDLPRLQFLRNELRERMAASPVCDGAKAARALEVALRGMWRAWCDAAA
jgi:predicted O-linked N-acetylglucosamine transferase (SPINDLY family)